MTHGLSARMGMYGTARCTGSGHRYSMPNGRKKKPMANDTAFERFIAEWTRKLDHGPYKTPRTVWEMMEEENQNGDRAEEES